MRRVSAEREVTRDTDTVPVVAFCVPADLVRTDRKDVGEPPRVEIRSAVAGVWNEARLAEHLQTQLYGVLFGRDGDFVDETLHGERMEIVDRRAPPAARHPGRHAEERLVEIGDETRWKIIRFEATIENAPLASVLAIRPRRRGAIVRPARHMLASIERRSERV